MNVRDSLPTLDISVVVCIYTWQRNIAMFAVFFGFFQMVIYSVFTYIISVTPYCTFSCVILKYDEIQYTYLM